MEVFDLSGNEWEVHDLQKFNNLSGMGRINYKGKDIFIVYVDVVDDMSQDELGEVVGFGDTKEKALQMAIVNISFDFKKIRNLAESLNEMFHVTIAEFCGSKFTEENLDRNPIFPIQYPNGMHITNARVIEGADHVSLGKL